MWYLLLGILIIAAVILVARAALMLLAPVLGICVGLFVLYLISIGARRIYHAFNPAAKKAFLSRRENEDAERWRLQREAELERQQKRAAQEAREAEELRRRKDREAADREALEAKSRAALAEAAQREQERQRHRDADYQDSPYTYEVGRHANEALAIRYGIANQELQIAEDHRFSNSSLHSRNVHPDMEHWIPSRTITIQKLEPLGNNQFIAALTDHGNRKVRVVIEKGTEYVKTFLPIDDAWFETHRKLEETLKHNNSFTLRKVCKTPRQSDWRTVWQ